MKSLDKEDIIAILVSNRVVDIESLKNPAISTEDVILYLAKFKIPVPESFFREVAQLCEFPYIDYVDLLSMSRKAVELSPECGLSSSFVCKYDYLVFPLEETETYLHIATANPFQYEMIQNLEERTKKKVRISVASIQAIQTSVDIGYQEIHSYSALSELYERSPDESANKILVPWHRAAVLGAVLLIILLLISDPYWGAFLVFTLINITYFIINPVKFYISLRGMTGTTRMLYVSEKEAALMRDEDLPVYTILVPLYREPDMLPHIIKNIYSLDYPKEKLDVKILMEEQDAVTLEKARKIGLFGVIEEFISPYTTEEYREVLSIFTPVIIPAAEIQTKPRACSYGLLRSRGEYVVIYDAEDYPDRNQLRKVAAAFAKQDPSCVCIQCMLNFYNPRKNILTRWFTIEYSYWYDYYLQGLDKVSAPIPLGGTSNHFRTGPLKDIGAWDPYNVTEDADLGMRIARRGYTTGILNSHTYEEAVSKPGSWIKQRSRWVKGFIVTWFVHMRHPVRVIRDMGIKKFFLFQLTFGGNFYMPLCNPLLWLVFILGFIIPSFFYSWFDFWPFAAIAVFNLLIGNIVYLTLALTATMKEKQYDLLLLSLFSPLYWVLISIGAWKGLLQLFVQPYKWEKTDHGDTFLDQDRIENARSQDIARPVTEIIVEDPIIRNGTTAVPLYQVGISILLTVILVLAVALLFGVIEYEPISSHVSLDSIPGLPQALAPFSGDSTQSFFNKGAIPLPVSQRRVLVGEETGSDNPLPVNQYQSLPDGIVIKREGTANDPILVFFGQPLTGTATGYEILFRYSDGSYKELSGITPPRVITVPGGSGPVSLSIHKQYQSGAKVPLFIGDV